MAAVGNSARQIRDSALRARSIRVLVTPTPISFAERRAVLQVLEQYGPVEVFKMSPGYYTNFISVTKEPMTAERLVASSPLTYNVTKPSRNAADDVYVADLDEPESFNGNQPSVTSEKSNHAPRGNGSPRPDGQERQQQQQQQQQHQQQQQQQHQQQQQQQQHQQFKLDIFPEPGFHHRFAMAGSPLHGPWPPAYERDRSFMAATLKQSLPRTMAGKGLAHWLVSLSGALRMERKAKRLQVKGWLPSHMKRT